MASFGKKFKIAMIVLVVSLSFIVIHHLYGTRFSGKDEPILTGGTGPVKLYWFIPDGVRAEPYLFNIYEWAKEGKLPNIRKMMDEGAYGFCKPVYPGHTPVNFATLFTGAYPEVHGISDGPMHTEGSPLTRPSVAGFRSTSKKVEPIWVTLEKQGRTVALLSIPGSTPPELESGYTMAGRWGGWGASFYAVNFEELGDGRGMREQGRHKRLFFFGPPLVIFEPARTVERRDGLPETFSSPKQAALEAWGNIITAYIYDDTDDGIENYDRIVFFDGNDLIADLGKGEWSGWLPIRLKWDEVTIDTSFRIKIIKLDESGFYRVRFFYNNINETLTEPSYLAQEMTENIGPMVDYVDSFPPQLIFYEEDKDTFIEEANMSFEWHGSAADYFLKKYAPDVFIHDIYTPNQMLTSRWWLGHIDPDSARYGEKTDKEREELWKEVREMYKKVDDILGEYLKNADENTVIAFTSDHGVVPLHKWVNLNNFFARKGWLKFKVDPVTGEPDIDWRGSKVLYLKFGNVYVNPEGLHAEDGNWYRASGAEYKKLRDEVAEALLELRDEDDVKPVMAMSKWENVVNKFRLPLERVGDLIIANRPGYGWNEEMTEDMKMFSVPLKTGYKQAIMPADVPAMWAPFMVMGPGVKKGYYIGERPINMVDQYPTLMKLIKAKIPDFVQGKPIEDIFGEDQGRVGGKK